MSANMTLQSITPSTKQAVFIARILMSIMFAESIASHALNYNAVLKDVIHVGIPFPGVVFPASLLFETLGVLALITGLFYRWGIILLIGFTTVSTLFFFPFWALDGANAAGAQQQFVKNFAIIGSLYLLLSIGSKSGC